MLKSKIISEKLHLVGADGNPPENENNNYSRYSHKPHLVGADGNPPKNK
jgi:hypothetical protein